LISSGRRAEVRLISASSHSSFSLRLLLLMS
jgi:hypothetical protein